MNRVLALAVCLTFVSCAARPTIPPKKETLAECLTRKGVVLYGASWCGPCHRQLELFGVDAGALTFVDCSPPRGPYKLPECDRQAVKAYPTWLKPGGERHEGVMTLAQLSAWSQCPL